MGYSPATSPVENGACSWKGIDIVDAIKCPFVVLVDSAEQTPFTFQNLLADARQQNRPLIVNTEVQALGRHPLGLGDYSIKGLEGQVHVERKSVSDFQGTVLGWNGGRRERFERELHNLSSIDSALVVVEGTFHRAITVPEQHSQKSPTVNAKILMRSVLGYQQDYSVQWIFCGSRRLAETATFRYLERFWRKREQAEKILKMI